MRIGRRFSVQQRFDRKGVCLQNVDGQGEEAAQAPHGNDVASIITTLVDQDGAHRAAKPEQRKRATVSFEIKEARPNNFLCPPPQGAQIVGPYNDNAEHQLGINTCLQKTLLPPSCWGAVVVVVTTVAMWGVCLEGV